MQADFPKHQSPLKICAARKWFHCLTSERFRGFNHRQRNDRKKKLGFSRKGEKAQRKKIRTWRSYRVGGRIKLFYTLVVGFNAQEIFANLAEKEKIKGHHSPEGRAIRTLSRALSGWSSGNLSASDVIVMCEQSLEDWLKSRLNRSPWSTRARPMLAVDAVKRGLMSRLEAVELQRIRNLRARADDEGQISNNEVERALEFCIELIEKHW